MAEDDMNEVGYHIRSPRHTKLPTKLSSVYGIV